MRLQLRLNLRRLVLALIALLSFGAILLKQSDGYLRASAAVQSVVSVNAASYKAGPLARGSLASVFGNNLAAETAKSDDLPPPMKLSNVTVQLTGKDNVTRDAGLVMVSPGQINFVIPDEMTPGPTKMVIKNGPDPVANGDMEVGEVSPALFTSGSTDSKLAVGTTSANGADTLSINNQDGSARMISSGSPWAPTTLTLLATGLRYAESVQVLIGDQVLEAMFVRPSRTPGVDEVGVKIPMNLRNGMNKLSLVATTRSSATASSGATTQAAGASQSTSTTVTSNDVQFNAQGVATPGPGILGAADVQTIIAQAVAKAQQMGVAATIALTDTEGNVVGIFKMNGATSAVRLGSTNLVTGKPTTLFPPNGTPQDPDGLEQVTVPLANGLGLLSDGAALAAISKAGTAAFFSTQGSAISTRTASFIVQENFPPRITSQPNGPLFGVQFSQLPCSDVRNPTARMLGNLPFGLSADPGGLPIYKNGVAVGGLGIEFDGLYSLVYNPERRMDVFPEEAIAMAGLKGYRVDPSMQIDRVLIDGMRLDYSTIVGPGDGPPAPPYATLPGTAGTELFPPRGQLTSGFAPLTLAGIPGRVTQGFFPFMGSQVSNLTAADVTRILSQAAKGAYGLRAGIRLPVPQPTEVNISVVDIAGNVLGLFSTQDAPQFGFDVCVQKARTAVFFSLPNAGALLRSVDANVPQVPGLIGLSVAKYADQAAQFGVPLNGQNAFTSRAMGALARPFFPDGINGAPNGPFSKDIRFWSPFNDGLQIALVKPALAVILTGGTVPNCSPIPNTPILANGFQIFAGSAALYKNGVLVGAVGVSGDGIDQDDFVASSGAFGYDAPAAVRSDQLLIRGVRLPYVKYPRHPNIGTPVPPPIIRTSRVFSNSN